MKGAERASENLQRIAVARQELERQREKDKMERQLFEQKLKIGEFELVEAEQSAAMEKQLIEGILKQSIMSMGPAEGGQVMAPEGATAQDGQIMGAGGQQIGEYMPGYEPQMTEINEESPYLEFMRNAPEGVSLDMGRVKFSAPSKSDTGNVQQSIMRKIVNGEPLTAGEQQLYDQVIKKKVTETDDELISSLGIAQPKTDQRQEAIQYLKTNNLPVVEENIQYYLQNAQ